MTMSLIVLVKSVNVIESKSRKRNKKCIKKEKQRLYGSYFFCLMKSKYKQMITKSKYMIVQLCIEVTIRDSKVTKEISHENLLHIGIACDKISFLCQKQNMFISLDEFFIK